jgi:uncharacterized protein YbbC (DUF1343 family)/CubicO group peptidase (beta-lactamase class C family)
MRQTGLCVFLATAIGGALVAFGAQPPAPPKLPHAAPAEVGMNAARLAEMDALVAAAIEQKRLPGAVVLVARRGKIAWLRAYGHRQIEPQRTPMTTDTLFDLASLTKPVATAASVMALVEAGKLRLDDPAAQHWPDFAANDKQQITLLHLLSHQGGLVADNRLADYEGGPAQAWRRIAELRPLAPPGERFIYSDVGFMVLGQVVGRVAGEPLDAFARRRLFGPLGMTETGFLPSAELRRRAAPTERRDERWMQGEVHDPRAYALGGVAGHAGLFSTAADLAVFGQMLLGRGEYAGVRVLSAETIAEMIRPRRVPGGLRGLGWDIHSSLSSNRSPAYSKEAFGHGGFTGTALWLDPPRELIVIFLSNRLHPNGKGQVNSLAAEIGSRAVAAIEDAPPAVGPPAVPAPATPKVLAGLDVLRRDRFALLAGRRVGLITNHTGVGRDGLSAARILRDAPGVWLVALFGPEHGIQGKLDTDGIAHGRDESLGLPIYSLYGKTRRPTPEMLAGLDTLVFDIQDIGTRFYTYITTMGYAMQAAAEGKLRFVVLDRPNPIGGVAVAGPLLDAGRESFTAFHRLPLRHGMTAGELAQLFNAELDLKLDLHVVRCEGWRRGDLFDATGLAWVNPSPNMRSLAAALLYPGIGLLETTNVSVGRGTATPFEVFGAPWINGPQLAQRLNDAKVPGIAFVAESFTPETSTHRGQRCGGVRMTIGDRAEFEPVRVGLEIARRLRSDYPNDWKAEGYDRLLGNRRVFEAVLSARPMAEIEALFADDLRAFCDRRKRFLLYAE